MFLHIVFYIVIYNYKTTLKDNKEDWGRGRATIELSIVLTVELTIGLAIELTIELMIE